jgi:hypothetical protein
MVYSVASDTVQMGRHTKVQSLGAGVYHGGGLCPSGLRLEQSQEGALPFVCHQPSGWCLRRLLPIESWSVMDVPWQIVRLTYTMEGNNAELALFRKWLPGWCLEQGLRVLLQGFGLMNEGGVLPFEKLTKQELAHSEKQEVGVKSKRLHGPDALKSPIVHMQERCKMKMQTL